jgi:methylphosphotriester-DNA--protein-cysteine methyltransferase
MGLTRAHFSRRYRIGRQSGPGEMIRTIILESIEQDLRSGADREDVALRFGWSSGRQLAQYVSRATGLPWRVWHAGACGQPLPPD